MRDFPKSTSTQSQARLRLTLLLCLYIFTCCLSLVFVADLYTGYELAWFDRAGLFTAALAVVPFAVVALLFAFGRFSGRILIGNFGDGRINVVEAKSDGRFENHIDGQVRNSATGRTLVIPGLWALLQGTATTGGTDAVWFSAGIDDETHGLLGVLRKP